VKNVQQNRRDKLLELEQVEHFERTVLQRALEQYFEISVSALQVKDQADSAHSLGSAWKNACQKNKQLVLFQA
jgi:hypothetical protein